MGGGERRLGGEWGVGGRVELDKVIIGVQGCPKRGASRRLGVGVVEGGGKRRFSQGGGGGSGLEKGGEAEGVGKKIWG